jgi:hypothetical protein
MDFKPSLEVLRGWSEVARFQTSARKMISCWWILNHHQKYLKVDLESLDFKPVSEDWSCVGGLPLPEVLRVRP